MLFDRRWKTKRVAICRVIQRVADSVNRPSIEGGLPFFWGFFYLCTNARAVTLTSLFAIAFESHYIYRIGCVMYTDLDLLPTTL